MDKTGFFLAFLQGISEFLPISSSGHLFLMEYTLGGKTDSLSFIIFLHLATFFSICFVFFKDIKKLTFQSLKKDTSFFLKFGLSLLPAIIVGVFFKSWVEQSFQKNTVAFGFLVSGLLLLSLFFIKMKNKSFKEMSFLDAFIIGAFQALAVFPGFSRSALTITAGIYCGLSGRLAVFFSFLISLPVILGASFFDFYSSSGLVNFSFDNISFLIISFLIAFISGVISLFFVLKLVQLNQFKFFSFYLIPLSLIVFLIL